MPSIKPLLPVLLAAAGAVASATPPPPQQADLRRVLKQVQHAPPATAVRKLSAEERAELRRQLREARQQRRRP